MTAGTTTITRTACPSWCDAKHDAKHDDALHRAFLFDGYPLSVSLASYDEHPDIAVGMDDDSPDPEFLTLRMAVELIGRLSEAVAKALEVELTNGLAEAAGVTR